MKKKSVLRTVIAVVLSLITVFAVTTAAAEYAADDGMSFEFITSKTTYDANEEVSVILLAKNYNPNMQLANISWTMTAPEGLTLLSGDLTGTQVAEVGERAAITLKAMKVVEIPEETPDTTEPTTPSTEPQGTDEEEDGISGWEIAVLIILILLVLAGIGVLVYLILKRRGVISCIALLLALGTILPCIPAVDVSAVTLNAGEFIKGEDNTYNATVKVTVDGEEYVFTAAVSYEMAPQTETIVEAMHSSMSDLEWTQYNAPTVVPTVGQHPRLHFTEGDIPDIIANLESDECADMAAEFYTYLGMTFNGTFSSLNATEEAEGRTNYNAKNLRSIRVKALYYALFKNSDDQEKATMAQYYGKTAVRAIQRAMETIRFSEGYDIYTRGAFQIAAAEVYDWCYDLLTHEDKQNIAALVQDIGAASEAGWPVQVGSAVTSHLAGDLVQNYWMSVAIAMYDEYPTFYEYIGGAYFQVFLPPRNAWNVSGTRHEGISYGVAGRGDSDMTAQTLIYQMTGGANDYDGDGENDGIYALDPIAETTGYHLLYSMRPDGQLLREGDVWEENQTDKNTVWDAGADAMNRLANLYKNGYYRRIAHEMSGGLAFTGTYMISALIEHDPDVESQSYYNLPYTRYFPVPAASMIARTGWDMGTASNDVIVKMQLSPTYLSNHQHRDAGAFQIYYKGILASESGYYVLYGTSHDLGYHKTSIAHNTLSITSIANRYGKQTTEAVTDWGTEGNTPLVNTVVGEEYGPNVNKPEYSYLAGDIAGSYDDNVQEAVRSMLFLNLELDGNTEYPGAFIVFDQIKTSEVGSKKSFLLHMQSEPEIDGNVITIKNTEDDYNGKLTDQVLYVGTATKADEDYTITKIGGPNQEFVVGKYNYAHGYSVKSSLCEESGWGRVEVTTTATETDQTDYLLNVMYVSDADGSEQVVPATLIYDGKGVLMGAQVLGHVAMFNMDGNNRISKDVSFTIPASEGYKTFKVNVAGLKAGTWTVYVNGKSVGTQVASEDGGMIYFEAAAGTVKLVYTSSESTKTFDETPNTDEEPIGMMINNFYYYTDAHPVVSGDDYLIPVSVTFEALNGKGTWNRDMTEYTVVYKASTYVFTKNAITRDGESIAFNEIRAGDGDLLLDMTTLRELIAEEGEIYYDKYTHKIWVDVTAQAAIPKLTENTLNKYPNAVQVEAVIDNGYSTLPLEDALDGDPTTRWCSQESDPKITEGIFDFGKVVPLTEMLIMFWTETSQYSDYIFDVQVSVDGVEWLTVHEKARSGEVNPRTYAETYVTYLMDCEARYVKIVGHGRFRYNNSGKPTASPNNTWFMPAEVIFLQKAIIDPDGAQINGTRLQAEAECFHMQSDGSNPAVTVVKNKVASGKEEVLMKVGYTTNPGTVAGTKAQLYATFIPKRTGPHYIWVRVNTSGVTSGDCMWVNIEGVTGDSYYAEKVNVGKVDSDGYRWIKLSQYEAQTALSQWKAGEEYTLSVISGCDNLIVDCFMVSSDASYVPYDDCYSKKTTTSGTVTVNAKDAIYEYSMAAASGTGAKLQKVSADGTASQQYIDYVLSGTNLPGDISANIITDTSGVFSIYATVKVSSLSKDQFFYAVSVNDSNYKYALYDLSKQVSTAAAGQFITVKLGEIEIQANESIYVRFKACSEGVTIGTITTTCVLPTGVYTTTNGKLTVQAEEATLSKAGEENTIIRNGVYYTGETTRIVENAGAVGGKAVQFTQTITAWNQMITYTSEPNPHITFQVMPDKTGEYYIWVKVYAAQSTSLYAFIEGGDDYYYWRQPLTLETYSADKEDFIWVRLYQECQNGKKLTRERLYNWTARRIYTISLRSMYSGVQVDQIYITNDPNDQPHNHSYSSQWSSNDTHHWYALTCGCQNVEPRYYGEHFFEDHTDKYCNTCGHANPNYSAHNYVDGICTVCGGLAPFATSNGKLTLEAENLMLAPDGKENHIEGYTGGVIKVVENADAEGGKAVQFRRTNSGWNTFLKAGTTPIPHLSVLVTPDKSGQYYIWLKVYAPENASYGAYVYAYIDGGSDTYYWRQPLNLNGYSQGESDYFWVCVSAEWQNSTAKYADHTYNWKAGQTYTLRFRGAVSAVQIDQIYITNSATDIPHNHTYSSTWEKDATYHWHKDTCGHNKIVAKAEHIYDNLLDTTCNTCGYVRPPHEHTYRTYWSSDATSHWHECACGAKTDTAKHTYVNDICSVCNRHSPFLTVNGKVTIEAEDGSLAAIGEENYLKVLYPTSTAVTTTAPMDVEENANASGGSTLRSNWTYNVSYGLMSYDKADYEGADPTSHATYTVTADTTGQVYIWLKVYAPNTNSSGYQDGIYCWIDGLNADGESTDTYFWRQPLAKADGTYSTEDTDFYWVLVKQAYHPSTVGKTETAYGDEKVYYWTAGNSYTLRFRSMSSGTQIDQIYITNDPNDQPHNHSYSSEWTTDETYHWHAATCEHSDRVSGKGEHTYDNLLDTTCNGCGYVRPAHEHTYGTEWSKDLTGHWHECACGAKADEATHTYASGVCSTCGAYKPFAITNGKVTIEAEQGVLAAIGEENYLTSTSAQTTAPMLVVENANASGGSTVRSNWTSNVSYGLMSNTTANSHATYAVTADTTGQYYIWLKVYAPNTNSYGYQDGIYCWIDGLNADGECTDTYFWRQPLSKADGTYSASESDFYWVCIKQAYHAQKVGKAETAYGDEKVYFWTAGESYILRFRAMSTGTQIDQIYITNDPNDQPHNHSYSSEWTTDETYHWHAANCGHSDMITGKGEHSYETLLDTVCSDCGYERPAHQHTYGTEWSKDLTGHWHECACGAKADEATHTYANGICSTCGAYKAFATTNGKVTIEAETATLYETGTWVEIRTPSAASGGQVVRFMKTYTGTSDMATQGTTLGAHMSIAVTPDVTGEYYIWLKVYNKTASGGVYCYIEGGSDTYYWRQPLAKTNGTYSDAPSNGLATGVTDYFWVRVYQEFRANATTQYGEDKVYIWTAGETYTLNFRSYYSGVQIDQIYITNSATDIPS